MCPTAAHRQTRDRNSKNDELEKGYAPWSIQEGQEGGESECSIDGLDESASQGWTEESKSSEAISATNISLTTLSASPKSLRSSQAINYKSAQAHREDSEKQPAADICSHQAQPSLAPAPHADLITTYSPTMSNLLPNVKTVARSQDVAEDKRQALSFAANQMDRNHRFTHVHDAPVK